MVVRHGARSGNRWAAKALAISLIMLMITSLAPLGPVSAGTITTFSDGKTNQVLDFDGADNLTVTVVMENDVLVSKAGFDIEGLERVPGQGFPSDVKVDVGDDGTVDWAFGGLGIGDLGHQSLLRTGEGSMAVEFTAGSGGSDTSRSIYLPRSAIIQEADLWITANGSTQYPARGLTLKGTGANEYFGWSGANVGDVNDDGWDDMVVGSREAAKASLFYGGQVLDDQPDLVMTSTPGSWFGQAVSGVGDVNDDNIDDLAVAENGTVRVFFGGPGLDAVPDLNLTGEASTLSYFGYSVTGGSDLDGDGHADIVVGDFYREPGFRGRAYVFNGGPGLDTAWDHILEGNMFDTFGHAVATGGDIDNDGKDDLVVSAPALWGWISASVWIYKGGAGFGGPPMALGTSARMDDLFGYSLAIDEDINGDHIDDIVVGAPDNGTGTVCFYWGRASWPASPDVSWLVAGEVDDDNFGASVAMLGDLDHDGTSELVIGAPFYDCPGNQNCGKAYFLNGSATISRVGAIEYEGEASNVYNGWWVARLGDMDYDGGLDFAISAVTNDSGRGNFQLYYSAYGMDTPSVRIGGQKALPFTDGPVLNGTASSSVPVASLQTAIDNLAAAFTDDHGNEFVELVVELSSNGPGKMALHDISINYSLDTSDVMALADAFNAHLAQARAGDISGQEVQVPIVVTTSTAGRIVLSDLKVDISPNQVPTAFIDDVDPTSLEAGQNITLVGHGVDDGTIGAYNWSSDLEGDLGTNASITVVLTKVGNHTIAFQVQDDMGRWSIPVTTTVQVVTPNNAPVVWIDGPLEGEEVHDLVMITGNASDPDAGDTLKVEIKIDDRSWNTAEGSSPWSYEWDTENEVDGDHSISVRASDGRLHSSIVSMNVTVTHPVPGISVSPPADVEAYAGDVVILLFDINNTGTGPGRFSLQVTTYPLMLVKTNATTLDLGAGEERVITIEVMLNKLLPPRTRVGVDLKATAVDIPTLTGVGTVTITIVPRPPDPAEQGVTIEPPVGAEGRPGDPVMYRFTLRNIGTAPDSYDLTVTSSQGWRMTVKVDNSPVTGPLNLGARCQADIEIILEIPANAKAKGIDDLTVTVQSSNFPLVNASRTVHTKVLSKPVKTNVVAVPWMPILATLIVLGAMGGVVGGTEWGRYGFFWLLIPLYSRLKREHVLDNFKRGEINAFIKLNPGTYYNEIKKNLDVSNGVLTYHLNKLEQEGYVKSKVNGRYKHYFSAAIRIPNKIIILNELQRALLRFIREYKGATQGQISSQLDIPVPSVSRHLKRLLEADLISVEKHGNLNYYTVRGANEEVVEETTYEYDETYSGSPPEY